jgi:hypothetical protein
MLNAGWMSVQRDMGDQTYWRIFIRTRNQDGCKGSSPGSSMDGHAISTHARAYEVGGSYGLRPPDSAGSYCWRRYTRRTSHELILADLLYRCTLHGVRDGGLDWCHAGLYPADALITPPPCATHRHALAPLPCHCDSNIHTPHTLRPA